MKTTFRTMSFLMILTWLAIGIAACSLFSPPPAPTLTPTVTQTASPTATLTNTPTATATATPVNHDGLWDGGTISDASLAGEIRFFVQNNRIIEMAFDYTLRTGGCTEITGMLEWVDFFEIKGNDFTAQITDSYDKKQLIITGTFASATEASGTLEFKGTKTTCGDFDKKGKWTANNVPIPPTRTPTIKPTATQPRPTASATPTRLTSTTPSTLATPVPWATIRTQRFSIMVPPGFDAQVPLRDVRMKFDSAQLIFMGRDRETGFLVEVTENPAIFHSAQRRMENRKGDLSYSSTPTTVLVAASSIKLNGREAAVLEYIKNDLATVMYFVSTEQEEFEIVIEQAKRNDETFIANAERIATSFTVDATPATPVPTQTPGLPALWNNLRTKRFALAIPSTLKVTVPLTDVQGKNGGMVFMAEDPQTGYEVYFSQGTALFGTAQKKWENRAGDFRGNDSVKIIKSQAGITVNGREAAVIEYVRSNSVGVEYFIVVGQEEFDIIFRYGLPDDPNFIATAERIVNSFTIDAAPSATPTK